MQVKAERAGRYQFPRSFEEIDEYRIYSIPENIYMGTVRQRYNTKTRKFDYRPCGVGIRGRAHAWTRDENEAIQRIIRAVTKPKF